MRVRRATVEDIPVITRLAGQLGGVTDADALPTRLRRILDHAHHAVFIAECDMSDDGLASEPCGFVAAEHRLLLQWGELIELIALVVDDASRRQGIGTQLVAAVEAWAARRGVARAGALKPGARRQPCLLPGARLPARKNPALLPAFAGLIADQRQPSLPCVRGAARRYRSRPPMRSSGAAPETSISLGLDQSTAGERV